MLQKKLVKGIKIFLRKRKRKNENTVGNDIKTSQKIQKKGWLSNGKIEPHQK